MAATRTIRFPVVNGGRRKQRGADVSPLARRLMALEATGDTRTVAMIATVIEKMLAYHGYPPRRDR